MEITALSWLILVLGIGLGFGLHYFLGHGKRTHDAAQLSEATAHRRVLEDDFDRLRAEHSAMFARNNAVEAELNRCRSENAGKTIQLEQLKKELDSELHGKDHLQMRLRELERELADLITQSQRLQDDLARAGQDHGKLRADYQRACQLLEQASARVESSYELHSSENAGVNELAIQLASARTQIAELLAHRQALQSELERIRLND